MNIPDKLDIGNWEVQHGTRNGTVGLPLPGTSFRVVDPKTLETLPPKEDGLILIGGNQAMLGYLNDVEKTAQAIVRLDNMAKRVKETRKASMPGCSCSVPALWHSAAE